MNSDATPAATKPRRARAGERPDERASLRAASHVHRLDAAVGALVDEWAGVVPALDRDVRAIAARIARIDDRLRARTDILLKNAGLSDNEFRLLAGLMRIGAPYRAAPTDISGRYVPVTSGGLTGLANRLERRGLIRRVSHPSDQRSNLIELTDAGRALALDTMSRFAAVEQELMSRLSAADRKRGSAFLGKLLHSIEASLP